jgi:rSAM/selenodomain-associated transferase 1
VIQLFMKAPRAGRVKTRLAAGVGDALALELYMAFVEDMLATCRSTAYPLKLMVDDSKGLEAVKSWLGNDLVYGLQEGDDLGERMANAFRAVFDEGCGQALLIGSDIPDLPEEAIREGFRALESRDAVIGPSRDGGYYLIGFRSEGFRSAVFEGVEWSSPSVFSQTRRLLAESGLSCKILPVWDDVDTFENLQRLFSRLKAAGTAPRTLFTCRSKVFRENG